MQLRAGEEWPVAKLRLEQELQAQGGSPAGVVETMTNLDTWARRLRDQLGGPAKGE